MSDDFLHRHVDYGQLPLQEEDIDPDPLTQLRTWLGQADQAGIYEPNAMVLSTMGVDGHPNSRTVLLRDITADGLRFFTSYRSDKGLEIVAHPDVSVLFGWYPLHRQVIVRGVATRSDPTVSNTYFADRPRGAQIAAIASDQSRPIADRRELEHHVADVDARLPEGAPVPRPPDWGGIDVTATTVEFWQGRTSRLHDRLRYTRDSATSEWTVERLQP